MKRTIWILGHLVLLIIAILASSYVAAGADPPLPVNIEKLPGREGIEHYKLKSNDMDLFLVPNHAAPVFTFMVLLKVGSRNETTGNTGSAHLLEHMLFNKSTENFGKGKPQTIQQALYNAGSSFDKSNATTWTDRTNYYDTLPSDQLELSIRIESDRMRHARILDEERQTEMTVVRNEYERSENDPSNALLTAMTATAIWAHPYHHDTLGWRSDIENVTTDKLRDHYNTYYWPNNAAAILVGEYDRDQALKLLDQYFGSMPKSSKPIPQIYTTEPPQEGERRVTVKRAGSVGWVGLAYKRPGAMDPDFPVLDVISVLMGNGVTSRLHQALVEKKLAASANSFNWTFRDPYLIFFLANPAEGVTHEKLEEAMIAEVERLKTAPVSEEELKTAKSKIEVTVASSRDGTYQYASQLGECIASADWQFFFDYLDQVKGVTAEQIKNAAVKYLNEDSRTVGWFVPKQSTQAPEKTSQVPISEKGKHAYGEWSAASSEEPAASGTPGAGVGFAARTKHLILSSGAVLDILENQMSPTVAIRGYLHAGSFLDPAGKPGLASVTAQMLDKGTESQSKLELARKLESTGASLSITVGATDIIIQGYCLSKDAPLILEMLSEMLRTPAFSEEELGKLKVQSKTALLEEQDSTFTQGYSELTRRIFPANHPYYQVETAKQIESLDSITVQDIRQFWKQNYGAAGLVLAVVGDVQTDEIARQIDGSFSAWKGGHSLQDIHAEPASLKAASKKIITMKDKANVDIFAGNASGLSLRNPDYYSALLANSVLGGSGMASRLSVRLRDTEGLTYGIVARFWGSPVLDPPWAVYVGVAPPNVEKALGSISDVIRDLHDRGIQQSELETEKRAFIGRFKVAMSDKSGIADQLALAETRGLGVDYLDKYPDLIGSVTLESVNQAVRKYIPVQDHMITTVAGDVPSGDSR